MIQRQVDVMTASKRLPRGLGYGPNGRVQTREEYAALLERQVDRAVTHEEREKRISVWRRRPNGLLIVKGDMS